uniref:Methyltranfer_dom domain-containing protein n=1 Tax=Syphacia muris TaxID=451379 RepID=A0A0N5AI94_9BILA
MEEETNDLAYFSDRYAYVFGEAYTAVYNFESIAVLQNMANNTYDVIDYWRIVGKGHLFVHQSSSKESLTSLGAKAKCLGLEPVEVEMLSLKAWQENLTKDERKILWEPVLGGWRGRERYIEAKAKGMLRWKGEGESQIFGNHRYTKHITAEQIAESRERDS